MSAVCLDGVRLAVAGRTVLGGASFSIADGEFIALLGPNGAGKTTLLRALLGLVRPAAGQLQVLGQAARPGNPAIGYMPQVRSPPVMRLTGFDHLAAGMDGARWGLPRLTPGQRQEICRVLALAGAEELAQRPLALLSGGERQRVMLAQALLGSPRLLLLDEPLASLDLKHQRGVVALVKRLQRQLGATVVMSAHDLNPLMGAMDRVIYLGGGQAAIGTVDEVITAPVLSRLYGAPMAVAQAGGRLFVVAADA